MSMYLPIQILRKPRFAELDADLAANYHKLKRVSAFAHLLALAHSLDTIGRSLEEFRLPSGLLAQPLKASERRARHSAVCLVW